jgi:1,4-alpha-glucan branching enzyme
MRTRLVTDFSIRFSMKNIEEQLNNHGYSAKNMAKPVNFYCWAPNAKTVHLAGDFNRWDPKSFPMERRVDGWWFLQVPLTHGHHQYHFLVDGEPVLDPQATGVASNVANEEVSLVAVS